VSWVLSISVRLNILPSQFGTAPDELDKRERVEDRACQNGTTTCSPDVSCSSSDTITLGVPYSTDYLSQFVSARTDPHESPAAYTSDDDHRKQPRNTTSDRIKNDPGDT
jgi:hypothetical protein